MSNKANKQILIKVPDVLKILGIICGTLAVIIILLSILAYLPEHPNFSIFTTYLSDIGDTPGWPQILFNSTTLVMAPIRYLIIVLVVLCLARLGAGSKFVKTILILGAISTIGTVMMTAVPFSVGKTIHLAGIPLYFFGLVIWQTIVGIKEWTLRVPRILPVLSFLIVIAFLVFLVLVMLYEANVVGRAVAPIWQWIGFFISLVWVYAHSIILRKVDGIQ